MAQTANVTANDNSALVVAQNSGAITFNQYGSSLNTGAGREEAFRGSYFSSLAVGPSPNFVSRPHHKKRIEDQLRQDGDDHRSKLLVVSGLRGAGKSQLVLEYLESHRKDYIATFWIDATSMASIERDFTLIFRLLYPGHEAPDNATIVGMVKVKLQDIDESRNRLVIFDGADEIENRNDPSFIDLTKYLPRLPGVHIIITTRIAQASSLSSLVPIFVKELEDEEALDLLQRCSNANLHDQTDHALAIIHELGNFALAISLAGAYIAEDGEMADNLDKYLQVYKKNRDELQHWSPHDLAHQYGKTVTSAWETSYNAVEKKSPLAARLLTCLSFLDYTQISTDIFRATVTSELASNSEDRLAESWKKIVSSTTPISQVAPKRWIKRLSKRSKKKTASCEPDFTIRDLKNWFMLLHAYSFVGQSSEPSRVYSMHKLVAEWGFYRLKSDNRQQFACDTLIALKETIYAFPEGRSRWENLLPHSIAHFAMLQEALPSELTLEHSMILDELSNFISLAIDAGDMAYRFQVAQFVARHSGHLFDSDDERALDALQHLASAFRNLRLPNEAEPILQEIVETRKRLFGDSDSDTMDAMSELAVVLYMQGKVNEAASMEEDLLEKRQFLLGDDHPLTLDSFKTTSFKGDETVWEAITLGLLTQCTISRTHTGAKNATSMQEQCKSKRLKADAEYSVTTILRHYPQCENLQS